MAYFNEKLKLEFDIRYQPITVPVYGMSLARDRISAMWKLLAEISGRARDGDVMTSTHRNVNMFNSLKSLPEIGEDATMSCSNFQDIQLTKVHHGPRAQIS